MEVDKVFILTVPVGSTLIGSDVLQTKLLGVPPNALDLWENGSRVLCLKKAGSEPIAEFPKERLEKLIEVRSKVGYKAEIELLKSFLKAKSKKTAVEQTSTK